MTMLIKFGITKLLLNLKFLKIDLKDHQILKILIQKVRKKWDLKFIHQMIIWQNKIPILSLKLPRLWLMFRTWLWGLNLGVFEKSHRIDQILINTVKGVTIHQIFDNYKTTNQRIRKMTRRLWKLKSQWKH